jgi:hypothetical protein
MCAVTAGPAWLQQHHRPRSLACRVASKDMQVDESGVAFAWAQCADFNPEMRVAAAAAYASISCLQRCIKLHAGT